MQHNGEIGTRIDLAKYRIEKAKNDLNSAKILFNANDCKGANNRAYYAIFHALEAVHALDGNSYRSHKETISNFNKAYVKTEVFPREIGRKIAGAEEIRHASDYDDFYLATKEEAEEQINIAGEIINLIENYCNIRISEDNT